MMESFILGGHEWSLRLRNRYQGQPEPPCVACIEDALSIAPASKATHKRVLKIDWYVYKMKPSTTPRKLLPAVIPPSVVGRHLRQLRYES